MKKKIEAGDVFNINSGGSVTVIDYIRGHEVVVKHNDQYGHIATVQAGSLRKGKIKNPYHPNVFGIGFIGVGEHVSGVNGKNTPVYTAWKTMISRCYDPKYHARCPTYIGCSVHSDWHNFQVFAEWYKQQPRAEGWHLDKDLITEGNKIYSADTCVFVPPLINTLLSDSRGSRGDLPQGVSRSKGKYRARLNVGGEHHELGEYTTPEKAFEIYKFAKEANVKHVADKYKNLIDPRVYSSLMRYKVTQH